MKWSLDITTTRLAKFLDFLGIEDGSGSLEDKARAFEGRFIETSYNCGLFLVKDNGIIPKIEK